MNKFTWRFAAIAVIYILATMSGLLLQIPSSHLSPFMPAAGFALAAILMCGIRCWPGIWSGAFLVYFWLDSSIEGALVAGLLATTATLQAIIGARLTRPYLTTDQPLAEERDIWRFLLLGGPVACLFASTLNSVILEWTSQTPDLDFLAHWLYRWTGDTLGVLLFTPITLMAWPGNGLLVQRKFGDAALPLVVSVLVITAAHAGFARYETSRSQTEIFDLMSTLYERGTDALPSIVEPLRGVERFFSASEDVSKEEYAVFTQFIVNQTGIDSVDWAPHVPAVDRSRFEEAQQRQGLPGFHIFELDDRNSPTAASDRTEYFPVAITAPLSGNEKLLGLDHGFEASRKKAMIQAVSSGEMYSGWCDRCLLPRDNKMLVFQPVFRPGFDNEGADEAARRASIRGFVVGEVNATALFSSLAESMQRQHIAFRISDITPGDEPRLLLGDLPAATEASWERKLAFTNRVFLVEMDPVHGYWNPGNTLESHLFLVFSVITGLLIVFSILSSWSRRVAAETLVVSRTAELKNELNSRLTAQRALRERENDLSITLNSIGDAVLSTDVNGNITRMNPIAEHLTGWSASEALNKPISDVFRIINAETRKPAPIPVDDVLRTGEIHGLANHTVVIARNGDEYHIADSAAPIRDDNGNVRGVVLVFRDVGKEREAEQALLASEERYRTLVNSAPFGVFVQCRGKFVFANPKVIELLGANTLEQLVGKEVLDFIHPDSRKAVGERIRKLNIERKPVPAQQSTWLRLDGSEFKGEATAVPHVHEDEPGALVILQDVTARKEAETQLIKARKEAVEANRAKSAFLAAMSHEIRTPMNGVIGMVEILSQSRLSSHQKDIVNTIRKSASTLLTIIDDILDFSKIEAGRMTLDNAPVSISDIVEGLCNSLVPVAASKNVDLSLFVSPDIPGRLMADELRLRQLLYNLVGNAIKFSAGSEERMGEVSVRVEIATTDPLSLVFRISDNGIGIKPEILENLFTPFTQAEVSTTRRFGGSGLGLAICKRLTDLMNGEVCAESVYGEGSEFTVTLPFDVTEKQPVASEKHLIGLDCILVEEARLHTADLESYLKHDGARVSIVESIDSALKLAETRESTVVVLRYMERKALLDEVALDSPSNVRHLVVTQGRRRRARVEKENLVTLDGNCIRRLSLMRAVAVAAGLASPEIFYNQDEESVVLEDTKKLPTVAEARAQDRLILIAEDDDINQHVILQQLRLLGYVGEVASNGAEALALWRSGNYALLLTDLHMPEIDGYTLAQTIRSEERERRMPIVALTANALRGEQNRARSVGMDAYLTKPVSLKLLRSTLEKWLTPPEADTVNTGFLPDDAEQEDIHLVDINVLKQLVGDEKETLQEFLTEYLDSARTLSDNILSAFKADDVRHVSAVAHKLKSSSRSVGALALGDLCAGLENAGKEGDREYIREHLKELEETLNKIEIEIRDLLSEQGWNTRSRER
ncbi:MAG: PAS domain S-box protein [Sedimenticola sp.]|nr:PAS domain S-box protein [Sedimenticola sp.]